jgi:arylsulfatase A-like enzyme
MRRNQILFLYWRMILGWAELGCYGNTFNETPNLDKLAKQGVRFTHAYAAAPVCSPYRAALLTGQHPARIGNTRLPPSELLQRPSC